MPRRDGTGPRGIGPLSGRGMGNCAVPFSGRGMGGGMGRRGTGRAMGLGHGATETGLGRGAGFASTSAQDEMSALRQELSGLASERQQLRTRLDDLNQAS